MYLFRAMLIFVIAFGAMNICFAGGYAYHHPHWVAKQYQQLKLNPQAYGKSIMTLQFQLADLKAKKTAEQKQKIHALQEQIDARLAVVRLSMKAREAQ